MFYACNSIDQVLVNRFSGFAAVSGRKSPFPITLAIGLYNRLYKLYYCTSRGTLNFMFDVCCCLQLTDVGRVTISVTPMPFVTTQPKRIAAGANKVSMATERSVSVSVVSMVILFERLETSSNVPNDLLVSFLEQNNLGYATCRTACGHGFDTF